MKPFDLKAAMRGEPIVTRDGRKARFVAYTPEAHKGYCVVVFISDYSTKPTLFNEDGLEHDAACESPIDLFMAPQPTRSINGYEFPEPAREPLKEGEGYWVVDPTTRTGVWRHNWSGEDCEFIWIKRGLIQMTEEGAQQQLKAMLAAVGGTA